MTNRLLENNSHRPIEQIGNTVHRPTHYWTPAVHDLLNYLQSVGFKHSPKVIGFDEDGREVLSYMPGDSGKAGWYKIHSDTGLRNYAKLLREYHDAVADYKPSADTIWAYAEGGLKPGEIVCHGDFGPWNITWDGETPTGIIDWDLIFPAKPSYDVLYALEWSTPFHDNKMALDWHHFEKVPNRKERVDVFLDAYGTSRDKLGNIADSVAEVQRIVGGHEKLLAERGLQPQVEWVKNGDLEVIEQRAQWTESHPSLFS